VPKKEQSNHCQIEHLCTGEHRDELMENWDLCSQLKTPKAIEPLK
jgi:hypothetical protein